MARLAPLEAFERIKNITYDRTDLYGIEVFRKDLDIIEAALKRNIELEEENKVLKTVRDNFNLYIEPKYKATLQFQQCSSMTQSEYEKFIEYFGEPRDE